MDSLVAIGSACSFIYSVVMTFLITDDVHGHVHNLYYESAAVVLTLVSLGKFMESRNMKKTKSAITSLMRLAPDTAILAQKPSRWTSRLPDWMRRTAAVGQSASPAGRRQRRCCW